MSDLTINLVEDYSLDLARGCLARAGVPVHLRRQSYEVLKYLVENRGHLISKDKVIEEVWKGRAVTDGSLGKCIEEIREALGTEAAKCLRNERGRGYILETAVAQSQQLDLVDAAVEDGSQETRPLSKVQLKNLISTGQTRRRTAITVLSGSALTIALTAAIVFYLEYPPAKTRQITSIAVLPFENVSGDPNTEYLSDGLTERLIDRLAQQQGLKVIARSSSFDYKRREIDVQEVARTLRVEALVIGRIAQQGDSLVVSAELTDGRDRTHIWAEEYTGTVNDFQQMQEKIVRNITEKLRLRAIDSKPQQVSRVNPQAYQFFLSGLFHYNQGTQEDLPKSLQYFNQAVLLDPNFALAWAWVSRANNNLGGNSLSNPKDTQVKAKAAAVRALELDETLAEAHLAFGRIRLDEWDWKGAEAEYQRAIELSPSLVLAHRDYAQFLSTMGRHVEALNENRRAQELDPMSIRLKRQEAWLLNFAGRAEEALKIAMELSKQTRPTTGAHRGLGFIYARNGMYGEAVWEFRQAINLEGKTTGNLCYLASALGLAGSRKEALQILDELNRTKDYVSPTELASVYAALNDTDASIALLQKAYDSHDLQLQYLNIDFYLDNLRSDPRFQEIVRRVGLTPTR